MGGCQDFNEMKTIEITLDPAYDWAASGTYLALSLTDPSAQSHFSPLAPVLGGGIGNGRTTYSVATSACNLAIHIHATANVADPQIGTCEASFDFRDATKIVLKAPVVVGRTCTLPAAEAAL